MELNETAPQKGQLNVECRIDWFDHMNFNRNLHQSHVARNSRSKVVVWWSEKSLVRGYGAVKVDFLCSRHCSELDGFWRKSVSPVDSVFRGVYRGKKVHQGIVGVAGTLIFKMISISYYSVHEPPTSPPWSLPARIFRRVGMRWSCAWRTKATSRYFAPWGAIPHIVKSFIRILINTTNLSSRLLFVENKLVEWWPSASVVWTMIGCNFVPWPFSEIRFWSNFSSLTMCLFLYSCIVETPAWTLSTSCATIVTSPPTPVLSTHSLAQRKKWKYWQANLVYTLELTDGLQSDNTNNISLAL